MKRRSTSKRLLLALAGTAVMAVGVVSSASALSLPEFSPTKGVHFTGTAGGVFLQEKTGLATYKCQTVEVEGEVVGAKEVKKLIIRVPGNQLGCNGFCENTKNAGSLETRELKGTLGYLSKSAKTVGLLVEPVGGGSDVSSCWSWARASNASINGDLILPLIGVVNSKTTEFKIGLHQKEGTQEIRKLEGEATAHQWSIFPEGFEEIPFGFEGSFQVKAAKSLEVLA
jgi:hypothetical protein